MADTDEIPVAAKSRKSLEMYVGSVFKVRASPNMDNAIRVESHQGETQLWVHPSYTGYKKAWESVFGPCPIGYQVDHIYHKGRAKQYGYQYVRLALVKSGANQSNGAGIEKLFQKLPIYPGYQLPEIRYADHFQDTKLAHKSYLPAQGYSERNFGGAAILAPPPLEVIPPQGGKSLNSVPKKAGSGAGSTALFMPTAARRRTTNAPLKFSCRTATVHPAGTSFRVVTAPRSYEWAAGVLSWVISGVVKYSNSKAMEPALNRILAGAGEHIPPGGGVLVSVVYQEPGNAEELDFSSELFMYAYLMGYGKSAQEAYLKYQRDLSLRGGATISTGTNNGWRKTEHHLWFTLKDL